MSWLLLLGLILSLALVVLVLIRRRAELNELSHRLSDLANAKTVGSHTARLQYPHIDLSRCVGCGTCVKACPEEGVLDLIHGQAVVIHGARCVGHGLCAEECPVGAIDLTLGDLKDRKDIPNLTEQFEVVGTPGLFLAGEVTGYALIRTAISHGTAIANEVANRFSRKSGNSDRGSVRQNGDLLDLCIVGAGPAGLAASLQAKARHLNFVTLEQEQLGGTVAKYPRRKLVMTQPVTLPLHGRLKRTSYSKEELMELWQDIAQEHDIPIKTQEEFVSLDRTQTGDFLVRTRSQEFQTRSVCLALGRRGTPRRLGVPGEDLPKVAYSLIDAQSYQGRRILVVGGGDSAIEAALGLSAQPGNHVVLSYRKASFFRIKARNESRLMEAIQHEELECLFESEVTEIMSDAVCLQVMTGGQGSVERVLANDEVFIMAGGIPPFKLLEQSGVSLNPEERPSPPPLAERGTGLLKAAAVALALALVVMAWVWVNRNYYFLSEVARTESPLHDMLRPSGSVGLATGIAAAVLIIANLCYLLRRSSMGRSIPGSLYGWMTSHVITGVLALLLVMIHGGMAPLDTVGGHAYVVLACLVITGAIGRYFYSFVPRAANGKELALEELNSSLATESTDWDRYGRGYGDETRREIQSIVSAAKWDTGFFGRLVSLLTTQSRIKRVFRRIQERGRGQGLSSEQLARLLALAKRTYRTALLTAHYEDLRAVLASWRYFHRWLALLMVLLAIVHIAAGLRYSRLIP